MTSRDPSMQVACLFIGYDPILCLIRFMKLSKARASMFATDGLASIWCRGISSYHVDVGRLAHIPNAM